METTQVAQARLIAAAPDLLAALQEIVLPYGIADVAISKCSNAVQDDFLCVVRAARAAIAKAVGP